MSQEGFEVQCYLYDLSQGMASMMSMAFLGKQIDGIWHSGLVVYGYEYFYGGGIQASPPGMTAAGRPTKVFSLGRTKKTQAEFHAFLQSIASDYTPEKYSLLKHNCNNFASHCARFLLDGHDIPSFITGLPEEALNSPLGSMLRPMIENMDQQMRGGQGGIVPWADSALSLPSSSLNPPKDCPASPCDVTYHLVSDVNGGNPPASTISGVTSVKATTTAASFTPSIDRTLDQLSDRSSQSNPTTGLILNPPGSSAVSTNGGVSVEDYSNFAITHDLKQKTYSTLLRSFMRQRSIKEKSEQSLVEEDIANVITFLHQISTISHPMSPVASTSSSSPSSSSVLVDAKSSFFSADVTDELVENVIPLFHRMLTNWPENMLYPVAGVYLYALRITQVQDYYQKTLVISKNANSLRQALKRISTIVVNTSSSANLKTLLNSTSTPIRTITSVLVNCLALPSIRAILIDNQDILNPEIPSALNSSQDIVEDNNTIITNMFTIVTTYIGCDTEYMRLLGIQLLHNLVTAMRGLEYQYDDETMMEIDIKYTEQLTEMLLCCIGRLNNEEKNGAVLTWVYATIERLLYKNIMLLTLSLDLELKEQIQHFEAFQNQKEVATILQSKSKNVIQLISAVE